MANISTRNLSELPDIRILQNLCKSLATLEAIICREWEYRYYSIYHNWDKSNKEIYFQMRNGSGDEFQVLFTPKGAVINGYAHESEMSKWVDKEVEPVTVMQKLNRFFGGKETTLEQEIWKGVIDDVPDEFRNFISGNPIKAIGTTFCIWRTHNDDKWNIGDIQFPDDMYGDGSLDLLYIFDNNPETYKEWAIEYYESEFEFDSSRLNLEFMKHIYDLKPLTREVALGLNPKLDDFEKLKIELNEIGYRCDEL